MFWEVKQELFIFFSLAQNGYKKSECISNYFQSLGIYANITNQYSCYSGYFSYIKKQDHHQKCHCQANKVFRVFSSFVTSSTKVEFTHETCWEEAVMFQRYEQHQEVQKSLFKRSGNTGKFRSRCSLHCKQIFVYCVSYTVSAIPRFEVVFPYPPFKHLWVGSFKKSFKQFL